MASTPLYAWPTPNLGQRANVPVDTNALANAIEETVSTNHAQALASLATKAPLANPTFTGLLKAANATFTGAVITPNGTASNHAVNKSQLDGLDLLAGSRVRWGNVVIMAGSLGNLRVPFTPVFPSTPRLVLVTGGNSGSASAYVYDGTNPTFPAPNASGFWVFGLPPNNLARVYYLAIL